MNTSHHEQTPARKRKGVRGIALDPVAIEQLHALQTLLADRYGIPKLTISAAVRLAIETGRTAIARAANLKDAGDEVEAARYAVIKAQAQRVRKYRKVSRAAPAKKVVDSLPSPASFRFDSNHS
jgi:hypothetical protein